MAKTSDSDASKQASESRRRKIAESTRDLDSNRLYLGNLSFDTTERDLEELFRGIGPVRRVEIVYHSSTQKSKGFGFIEMLDVDEAKRAIEVLHDQFFMGRKMIVSPARSGDSSQDGGKSRSRRESGRPRSGETRRDESHSDQPEPTEDVVTSSAPAPSLDATDISIQTVEERVVEASEPSNDSAEPATAEPEPQEQAD